MTRNRSGRFVPAASLLIVLVLLGPAVSSAGADLQLSFSDGRVSIVARDVSVAAILAEWERIGRTVVIHPERLAGDAVVTLELQDVSEGEALAILLRSTGGYIARGRDTAELDASRFDFIAIMRPGERAPAESAVAKQREPVPGPQPPVTTVVERTVNREPPESPARDQLPVVQVPVVSPDVVDDPPVFVANSTAGAVLPPSGGNAGAQLLSAPRHALEVVDPRDFKLPPQGVMLRAPQGAGPPGGTAIPGMIVPAPAQGLPRPPGQPVNVR